MGGSSETSAKVRSVVAASAVLSGPTPAITFDIAVGPDDMAGDLFVEAADGTYLPMTANAGKPAAGIQRFKIDLKGVDNVGALAGQTLRLTITRGDRGTEVAWVVR